MAMSLPDGVNMSERQEYRWLIHNGAPSLRLKALESLFHKFDLNGSGELDYDEFKKILWWLEYSLTDGGVREIFDELDEDKSNCLDITEFVRFFDVLEKYRNMYESDIKERQISLVRLKICQLFFVAITMATGFFAYSWVAASATGGDTGTWLTMTLIGASMLIIGVFLLAAWPIIAMKIAARQHAKEAKAMAEMYKSQRMAEGGVVEDDEDFATKEKRLQRGSKNRVSPTKGGAGRGGVDLNQSMTESMYGQQSPKGSTYRMTRMNMMEQSIMSSSLGHTSRFSPTGGGGGAGHSPMSGAQYQLQDLSGRQMRPDMTDEELIAEQQALEEHEDFAYHQGNYDLAKIQQGNLQPSTFHPMGTTRYKGGVDDTGH
ncbi:unnamed protein product [Amoebophrya sp. A25]|nr:unnamed protein product [Amoebophrya sp. A25]|eukprot:GSA25T00008786001.1